MDETENAGNDQTPSPYDEEPPRRGIAPTKIPRTPLYEFAIKIKLNELTRWKPRICAGRNGRTG